MHREQNTLMARFANEVALVNPEMRDRIEADLNAVTSSEDGQKLMSPKALASASGDFWFPSDDWRACYRPYTIQNGILHIPVKGVLLHNFPWQFGNYATGYDYILRAFLRGVEDFNSGAIKGIALVIDSPGGMVAGCFDATDKMVAAKTESGVPVRSFAHESAYSAAYAMAVVGDQIVVSRTGGVGSVGVVTSHMDVSKALEKSGLAITFIHAGKHKVDGNPYEPLPADVKARIQERIDELYAVFVSSVAQNRGLEEQAVRDTEALCFTASQAKSNGFADQVGALDDALVAFAADLSEPSGDDEMSNNKDTSAAAPQAAPASETTAAPAAAESAPAAADVGAERARISAILGHTEAKGRESLAHHLALETDNSVEAAAGILKHAPKASAEGGESPFENAMNNSDHPNVGAGAQGDNGGDDDADGGDVVALVRSSGIAGFGATANS